ncbi:MAG: aldehyde dehydrogenase (NADP(+)) [Bacteroidetes bacterium]|nr:aldehyde dehydrogenase (NADP(+)) [Bacteroidota bacterium]
MLSGLSVIGSERGSEQQEKLFSFSTLRGADLPEAFSVASQAEIDVAIAKARLAFPIYAALPATKRAGFLEAIAAEISAISETLVERAHLESGLPIARLQGECGRTVNQLKLFAAVLNEGSYVEAVIDPALPDRQPLPRADLRKWLIPLGPVAVFAASNFPLAFSTAGGDTASALASGCPVIVKAHQSHLGTNELVAVAIQQAAKKTGMPDGVFSSIVGGGATLGQTLAAHEGIKAVGFTGSYRAGMSIFRKATLERKTPIPVYAEMSSINPVLLLPEKIAADPVALATQVAGSVTLGVGQFCTNPGLLFVIKGTATANFEKALSEALLKAPAGTMLNKTICSAYYNEKEKLASMQGVELLVDNPSAANEYKGSAALMKVNSTQFRANEEFQNEVFGPSTLLVSCESLEDMVDTIATIHGQLTGSVFGTEADFSAFQPAINILAERVGRLIYNAVPTGVEVCYAMVHGGPYPATTDGRSTSVGADAIKRFLRPVCLQDAPAALLPDALKNENPLGIMRKLNGVYTRDVVV